MKNEAQELKKRLEQGNFAADNGRIIRAINVLRGKWIGLDILTDALPDIEDMEHSLIYLERAGYITARSEETRSVVEIVTADPRSDEVTLTKKGMDLAMYYITDPAVRV